MSQESLGCPWQDNLDPEAETSIWMDELGDGITTRRSEGRILE